MPFKNPDPSPSCCDKLSDKMDELMAVLRKTQNQNNIIIDLLLAGELRDPNLHKDK